MRKVKITIKKCKPNKIVIKKCNPKGREFISSLKELFKGGNFR